MPTTKAVLSNMREPVFLVTAARPRLRRFAGQQRSTSASISALVRFSVTAISRQSASSG